MIADALTASTIVLLVAISGRNAAILLDPRRGPERWLVGSVMGVTTLLSTLTLLGAIGLFETVPIVIALLSIAVGSSFVARDRRASPTPVPMPAVKEPRWTATLAYVGVALTALVWAAGFHKVFTRGVVDVDSHHYHLPHALRFAQTGEILPVVHVWDGDLAAFHPLNDELIRGAGFLVGRSDLVGQLWSAAVIAIGLLAAYCIGRRAGRPGTSVLVGVGAMAMPGVVLPFAGGPANDLSALALLMAAAALAWGASSHKAWLVVGCAAGASLGTKLTVVPAAACLLLALVFIAAARRDLIASVWMGAGSLVTGGVWYLRNWAVSGNPIPGLDLPLGPFAFNEPTAPTLERVSHSVLEYSTDTDIIRAYFLPGLRDSFGPAWPVVFFVAGVGALAGVALLWRRPNAASGRAREAAVLFGLMASVAAVGYLLTPTGAVGPEGDPYLFGPNLRYALPAIVFGSWAAVVALSARWSTPLAAAVSLTSLSAGVLSIEGFYSWRHAAVATMVAAAVAVGVWAASLRRMVEIGVLAAVTLGVALTAGPLRDSYLDRQYRSSPQQAPLFRAVSEAPSGTAIAVLGVPYSYGYAGRNLQNSVTYVGEVTADDGHRSYGTCVDLVSALSRSGFDYVAVNRGSESGGPAPKEQSWLEGLDGLDLVAFAPDGGWVYRVEGALDPDDCRGDGR